MFLQLISKTENIFSCLCPQALENYEDKGQGERLTAAKRAHQNSATSEQHIRSVKIYFLQSNFKFVDFENILRVRRLPRYGDRVIIRRFEEVRRIFILCCFTAKNVVFGDG